MRYSNCFEWYTKHRFLLGTDLHDGSSLTDSGYPRTIREWKRGTPLQSSQLVFEGDSTDVSVTSEVVSEKSHYMNPFHLIIINNSPIIGGVNLNYDDGL
jgi:prolyl oligopeptidase PreP (S9A serine peptidase family)